MLTLASSSGISVPDELAVIGVDDDPVICERTTPTLSSIRLDFGQGGYICAELLDRHLHDPSFKSARIKFAPVFVTRRQSTRRFAQTDKRVARAVEFIRRKACDGIGAVDVAAEIGVSRRMAEIRFKAATGRTIGEEILERRLAAAREYLASGRTSISAIADFCGWNSLAAFRKAFKDRFGVSPIQFRDKRP